MYGRSGTKRKTRSFDAKAIHGNLGESITAVLPALYAFLPTITQVAFRATEK